MKKETQITSQKHHILNQHSNYTEKQQNFLTMFNFEHSQIRQIEFDKLAKQVLKYSTVYATSKFDVGKIGLSLHLPLKPDAIFKKQRASKVPIHLHDKVNRLLVILEQYEIILPATKEEQPKDNTFINSVIILAKEIPHLHYLHEKLQLKYQKILNFISQKMKHHPD